MLNADYKIISKALSERLTKFLPKLISNSQVGYVKGRNIVENIRSLLDIMEYLKHQNLPGILINIDFEKAFDSVDHDFLFSVLESFNFGPTFITWVKTLYKDISSCTINKGFTSRYFPVERGVRQGDPLSPYLFILVVEVMALHLKLDQNIKGIQIGDTNVKLLQYADDTSGLLADIESAKAFLKTVEKFGSFSGLKMNIEKTEGMWLGSVRENNKTPLGISWPKRPLRILGVYASYDSDECDKMNFGEKLKKASGLLQLWATRKLTIYGKVQIVRTFIISQFNFVFSVLLTPKEVIKKLECLIFKFLWKNKKERIKRNVLICNISQGGMKVPDVNTMKNTFLLKWIKRISSNQVWSPWRQILYKYCDNCKINLHLLLHSNYNMKTLPVEKACLPDFYYELLQLWSEFGSTQPGTKNDIVWYNKNIIIQGKSVFCKQLFDSGLWFVQDLLDENGKLIQFQTWHSRGVHNRYFLVWMGLVTATRNLTIEPIRPEEPMELCIQSKIGSPLSGLNNRLIYEDLLKSRNIHVDTVHLPRVCKYFEHPDMEWSNVYLWANEIPLDTKTREFKYKFLNDLLANNYWLCKWGIRDSPHCTYCNNSNEHTESETIVHMFWDCIVSQQFWQQFKNLYDNNFGDIDLTKELVFFGTSERVKFKLILAAKIYIYNKRIHNEEMIFEGFLSNLRKLKAIEKQLAIDNNNLDEWYENWNVFD